MRPLLHIGYYKTGTTFLQTRIFPEPDFSLVAKSTALWSSFVEVDPFAWSPSKDRETFETGIREAVERGLVPVLSAERQHVWREVLAKVSGQCLRVRRAPVD
jgi:hypothetical protein